MSPFDALGECSSNESAAASEMQLLSDNSQYNFLDYDDCLMEAADAAKQEKPKIFSKQTSLQNFFKPSELNLTVEQKSVKQWNSNYRKL